jgi:transposase
MFTGEPGTGRILWLFSLVLDNSRILWAHFVLHEDLPPLLRCHAAAFEAVDGAVPEHILYDRMRTVFSREDPEAGHIVCNRTSLEFAVTTATLRRRANRTGGQDEGQGQVAVSLHHEDFFLSRSLRNLDDLNQKLRQWLDRVGQRAGACHDQTRRGRAFS